MSWGTRYLEEASLGGDHQDVRVAVILHSQQLVLCGAAGTKQEWRAGSTDLTFVSHVAELVELAVVIGNIISWGRMTPSELSVQESKSYLWTTRNSSQS